MAGAVLIVHFGAGAREPLGVVLFRDRAGERSRLAPADPTFRKPPGDAVFDYLTHGAKLFADGLRLPHQRVEHNVGLALLVAEIPAENLFRRLQLAIDPAVPLLQP